MAAVPSIKAARSQTGIEKAVDRAAERATMNQRFGEGENEESRRTWRDELYSVEIKKRTRLGRVT